MKVTDKRMFTPDGELREEFRRESDESAKHARSEPEPRRREAVAPNRPAAAASQVSAAAAGGSPLGREVPPPEEASAQPTFYDLVAFVAQPVALYLGDARLPDGEVAENLELARLHIDLLKILRQKAEPNLSEEELAFLDDLLYQLRLRYVQKRR